MLVSFVTLVFTARETINAGPRRVIHFAMSLGLALTCWPWQQGMPSWGVYRRHRRQLTGCRKVDGSLPSPDGATETPSVSRNHRGRGSRNWIPDLRLLVIRTIIGLSATGDSGHGGSQCSNIEGRTTHFGSARHQPGVRVECR